MTPPRSQSETRRSVAETGATVISICATLHDGAGERVRRSRADALGLDHVFAVGIATGMQSALEALQTVLVDDQAEVALVDRAGTGFLRPLNDGTAQVAVQATGCGKGTDFEFAAEAAAEKEAVGMGRHRRRHEHESGSRCEKNLVFHVIFSLLTLK
jgi:hypothetical protein